MAACSEAQASPPLQITTGDACADAYFWATTDGGDVAVRVLGGDDLGRNLCTDLPDPAVNPRSRQAAVAGEGTVTLDPVPGGPDSPICGSVSGELQLRSRG